LDHERNQGSADYASSHDRIVDDEAMQIVRSLLIQIPCCHGSGYETISRESTGFSGFSIFLFVRAFIHQMKPIYSDDSHQPHV